MGFRSLTSRYTFPIPIPASHTFFLSELDYKDGFIHMSTAKQVPKTLERFFADVPSVTLLRMEYERLAAWKRIIWEGEHDSGSLLSDRAEIGPSSRCRVPASICSSGRGERGVLQRCSQG